MIFDRHYTVEPSQLLVTNYTFDGYQNSKMSYDFERQNWKMEMLPDPKSYAITNVSFLPFGTQEYLLSDDLGGDTLLLNLNSCDNDKEYGCQMAIAKFLDCRCLALRA